MDVQLIHYKRQLRLPYLFDTCHIMKQEPLFIPFYCAVYMKSRYKQQTIIYRLYLGLFSILELLFAYFVYTQTRNLYT